MPQRVMRAVAAQALSSAGAQSRSKRSAHHRSLSGQRSEGLWWHTAGRRRERAAAGASVKGRFRAAYLGQHTAGGSHSAAQRRHESLRAEVSGANKRTLGGGAGQPREAPRARKRGLLR
jgi:hypothetical protein